MKRSVLFSAVASLVLLFADGCAHTSRLTWSPAEPGQKSGKGYPVLYNLRGINTGVYLFYFIPLWCGEPGHPNQMDYDTFCNYVRPRDADRLMRSYLHKLEADDIDDLRYQISSTGWMTLWIFWKRTITAQAVAVKKGKVKK